MVWLLALLLLGGCTATQTDMRLLQNDAQILSVVKTNTDSLNKMAKVSLKDAKTMELVGLGLKANTESINHLLEVVKELNRRVEKLEQK